LNLEKELIIMINNKIMLGILKKNKKEDNEKDNIKLLIMLELKKLNG